jgi:hypothetical protein
MPHNKSLCDGPLLFLEKMNFESLIRARIKFSPVTFSIQPVLNLIEIS